MKITKSTLVILISFAGIITLSILYYFVIRPIQKDQPLKECLATTERGYQVIKDNFEKSFNEGKIDEQKKSEGLTNAYLRNERIKDECYKKFK